MALEDRCSPNSASSPGPKASSDRPGSDGNAVHAASPTPLINDEKSLNSTQTITEDLYDLNRIIKIEPGVERDNFEEKKTRIWRKISAEEEGSISVNADPEVRLSPNCKKVKTSQSPDIVQRFSSYSIERFVNSDGGENSSGNTYDFNGQYSVDVNTSTYLNVPTLMSKTHKNISMLGASHQKLSRPLENSKMSSSAHERKFSKRVDSANVEENPENSENRSNNDNTSNNNTINDSRIKFSVENILKPDFGSKYNQKSYEIWNPLKRTVTPIIRTVDELRKPNRIVQSRSSRSFDIARLTENNEFSKHSHPEDTGNKRRHTDIFLEDKSKASNKRKITESENLRHVSEVSKESPTRVPLPSPAASSSSDGDQSIGGKGTELWPAWVYCTRYSDRPSSGPRSRRIKRKDKKPEEKRPRTAFSGDQLSRLKHEFAENRYLTERRRQDLAKELGLNEAQIKIWFQNKRAKMKKARGEKNPLALQLMAQGLYNHSTIPVDEDEYLEEMGVSPNSV